MSKVIAVNAGSSSLKFKLFEMPQEKVICSGLLERIGLEMGNFVFKMNGEKFEKQVYLPDHKVAVQYLVDSLLEHHCVESLDEIKGVGHRVVQGGHYFNDSLPEPLGPTTHVIPLSNSIVTGSANDLKPCRLNFLKYTFLFSCKQKAGHS